MISIVLPVHNQAAHVVSVIRAYTIELDKLLSPYELILVVNGCTDDTPRVCHELNKNDPRIRVCELSTSGWGLAVKTGISLAQGELICYTNSARTTGTDLSEMLKYALINKTSVIKANRKIREGFRRRLGSVIYNLECRALFDLPTWDVNGTPKVFPKQYTPLLNLERADDLIDLEFVSVCRRHNFPILEIPIISTRRHGGSSTTNYNSAFKMYWGAIQLWWKSRSQK